MFFIVKDIVQDWILGLKKGVDDYLIKFFNLEELFLCVNNLIKWMSKSFDNMLEEYEFGGNWVNFVIYEVKGNFGYFILIKKEVMLLKLFVDCRGEVVLWQ